MKKIFKKQKKARRRKEKSSESSRLLKAILGTLLLSLAVGGGLLVAFTVVLTFLPDPLSFVLPLGLLSAALTAFMGGFFATRIYRAPALSAGLINGILLTALSLLIALFFAKRAEDYATGYSAAVSALLHAGVVGLSIGGAFLGAKEKTPNKQKRRKRR